MPWRPVSGAIVAPAMVRSPSGRDWKRRLHLRVAVSVMPAVMTAKHVPGRSCRQRYCHIGMETARHPVCTVPTFQIRICRVCRSLNAPMNASIFTGRFSLRMSGCPGIFMLSDGRASLRRIPPEGIGSVWMATMDSVYGSTTSWSWMRGRSAVIPPE